MFNQNQKKVLSRWLIMDYVHGFLVGFPWNFLDSFPRGISGCANRITIMLQPCSQALVSFILERELPSEPFSLVAKEDSRDLCNESGQETLKHITEYVIDTLASEETYDYSSITEEDVIRAIDSGKFEGGSSGRHWVLDPTDGTKGFLQGDQYAIALALLHEGKVILGVLACPNLPLASIGTNHEDSSSKDVYVTATDNPAEASFFESFEAVHSSHGLSSSIAEKQEVWSPMVQETLWTFQREGFLMLSQGL